MAKRMTRDEARDIALSLDDRHLPRRTCPGCCESPSPGRYVQCTAKGVDVAEWHPEETRYEVHRFTWSELVGQQALFALTLWAPPTAWMVIPKFTPAAARLADGHYSRRTIGSPQFMPPGQTLVLLTPDEDAVFGWWRPDPDAGIVAMNGLDGWTCTIFRNTGPRLSSELILDAERELLSRYDCGPDGLLTYVWDSRVRSVNPGACFKFAGWKAVGRSADGRKTLLQKRVR